MNVSHSMIRALRNPKLFTTTQIHAAYWVLLRSGQQDEQVREQAVGCECGEAMSYVCRRPVRIVSLFGRVSYRRGYYLCEECHARQSPLDRRLGIEAGQVTAGLAELLALAGVEIAFEEATRWLEHYFLFRVSDNTLRKETERFGELQGVQETQWGEKWASRRVGEQNDLQAQDITYSCDFKTGEDFGDLFWASACQRQADLYDELVFVCDGATWIWKLIERHFPQAMQIVDRYHASEYLPRIAEAAFRPGTPHYQAWLDNARSLLWEGQIDKLLQACQQLASQAPTAVHKAVTYFTNNHKRIEYARFGQLGYFSGSGTVQGAGKQIASLRLKRAGARWTERGALLTAKARAAWLSGTWDRLASKRAALSLTA